MNTSIKKITLGTVATVTLSLVGIACQDKFLEIPATGQLSGTQLSSKAGIEGSLISVYAMLNGRSERLASASNWLWGGIRGGDANKGTDPGDFSSINPIQRFETISTGDVASTWRGKYEAISRANATLKLLASAGTDVSASEKKRIEGEARFLRGFNYFELKRLYNNTPYVDETVDYAAGIEKVSNTVELYPKIEADLKFAYDNLPETQSAVGRVNKWAGAALLAKVYMYQKKFTEAKALYDLIIANGKTSGGKKYGLVARYPDLFKASNDNNEESVFAIQAAANTGSVNNANPEFDLNYPYNTGPNGPGNCCGFNQPSFEYVNSFRTTATGLPLLDGSYNSAANAVKNDMGVLSKEAFTPDAGNLDPRLDHAVGRRGIPYLDWQDFPGADWIRNQPNGGPYSPKKFTYYKSDVGSLQDNSSWTPGYSALNFPIIRFADVLLMAAEAEIEVGSLTKALEYTNLVRKRAANPASFVTKAGAPAAKYVIAEYPATLFASKDDARKAVRFERRLELGDEGHRFFDLVRWGVAAPTLNAYLAYEGTKLPTTLGGATFTANQDEYLPIPQAQIDLQGKDVLKQNPGY
ncbi:RagB/SusD family nutrient uptake outer membrane protein [Spirosoma utsteinense]|uniref:Tetratricopeptide (TPR) repeat protein n=1 Tax=Spirosoma utsteinense TaxID=2585773 RepID=A0ABR6W165_9BACT|nr:RagB/SusD family nutrient uptake outer membrane protein [Spirosoma utsteinense]MBC3786571.1 tetratricopeptide (TPR) repeat protein [Spirosoma utsteinense]MBC3789949.1 tetratricopeptide (TPR) repeat protein [Spirosoma utsteinense]